MSYATQLQRKLQLHGELFIVCQCDDDGNLFMVKPKHNGPKVCADLDTVNRWLALLPEDLIGQFLVLKVDLRDGTLWRLEHVYKFMRREGRIKHIMCVDSAQDCVPFVQDGTLRGFEITNEVLVDSD